MEMILIWLILLPLIGGILSWMAGKWHDRATRVVALLTTAGQLILALWLWAKFPGGTPADGSHWLLAFSAPWIPQMGIRFALGLDGVGLSLILLTGFIGLLSVVASWVGIRHRVPFFHFQLLWTLAGITGVFLATDLFLFYLCWELILVPLYFLIDVWGYERRHAAAVKFALFTQLGGLMLLLGLLGYVLVHRQVFGVMTFDYLTLLNHAPAIAHQAGPGLLFGLMLCFFIAFAVKLPVVPLHTWLPDAHTQAPIAGSVDLAGLVLKVGAFGLLKLTVPLFPTLSPHFAPIAMSLGVIGILYGAIQAFGQPDFKRLIAYTSISHMGFVLIGIYAWNELALQGSLMIMIAHGLSASALFILVGVIGQRLHTREFDDMGGLFTCWPRMGGVGVFLASAALGLPGLATFVGEFLVLLGTFRVAPVFAALASLGMVVSVIYAVWIIYRVFWGPVRDVHAAPDLNGRESVMLYIMVALILGLGLHPQPIFTMTRTAVTSLLNSHLTEGGDHVEP